MTREGSSSSVENIRQHGLGLGRAMVWAGQELVMVCIVVLGQGVVNIVELGQSVVDIVELRQGMVDIVELRQGMVDIVLLGQGMIDILVLGQDVVDFMGPRKAVIIFVIRGLVISGSWAGGRHHFTPEKSI